MGMSKQLFIPIIFIGTLPLHKCGWLLSDIEQEVHNVSVLHDVLLAFHAEFARSTAGCLGL